MQLRDIAMSGYDVWGETGCWGGGESVRFRIRRRGCITSSAVTMPVECFFRRPHALWGERVVRKYCMRPVPGVVDGQDDAAMFGRM